MMVRAVNEYIWHHQRRLFVGKMPIIHIKTFTIKKLDRLLRKYKFFMVYNKIHFILPCISHQRWCSNAN